MAHGLAEAQIVVNELMASNSLAVSDPDFDESSDWVELHNLGAEAVDLSGWFATDDLNDATKWAFPSGTVIPDGGFLVLWCDGEATGLHTSYKLSSAGEEIGVFNASLEVQDAVFFEAQDTDISWGRSLDGSDQWAWFEQSTPGASNNNSVAYEGVVHHVPHFSEQEDSRMLLFSWP